MQKNIKDLILSSGYSITYLSKETKVSRKTIYNILRGKSTKETTVFKLLKRLDNSKTGTKELSQMEYIISLQKDKISYLEIELEKLKKELKIKRSKNETFENMDYDFMTHQTYDVDCDEPYKWFTNYEIIRWKDFFKKLGYVGQEAVDVHDCIQARSINSKDYKGKNYNIIEKDITKFAIYDHVYTKQFFQNAKLKHFINAVESYHVNYIHKDGSSIPAVIFVYYDIKGDSSISKIKFLDTNN